MFLGGRTEFESDVLEQGSKFWLPELPSPEPAPSSAELERSGAKVLKFRRSWSGAELSFKNGELEGDISQLHFFPGCLEQMVFAPLSPSLSPFFLILRRHENRMNFIARYSLSP